jgi:hypothetical protein
MSDSEKTTNGTDTPNDAELGQLTPVGEAGEPQSGKPAREIHGIAVSPDLLIKCAMLYLTMANHDF